MSDRLQEIIALAIVLLVSVVVLWPRLRARWRGDKAAGCSQCAGAESEPKMAPDEKVIRLVPRRRKSSGH